jgi:transcriptional regulator with XRE-family HTH domain
MRKAEISPFMSRRCGSEHLDEQAVPYSPHRLKETRFFRVGFMLFFHASPYRANAERLGQKAATNNQLFVGDIIHVGEVQFPEPAITITYDVDRKQGYQQEMAMNLVPARARRLTCQVIELVRAPGRLGPMRTSTQSASKPGSELGALLRHWRDARRRSQFDLSIDTGVSQRHISFIESGRSAPGRQTLLDIAQALDIPLRDRNTLLLAAGFAPLYSEGGWNTQEMQGINRALERMLRQHEPFPAVVMDRYWNIFMANDSAPRFFNSFNPEATHKAPRNMLHLMFDPARMRPFIANWESVAKSLFERVYRESVGRIVDEKIKELLAELLAYPGVQAYPDIESGTKAPEASGRPSVGRLAAARHPAGQRPSDDAAARLPIIPIGFVKDGQVLNYFSLVATVGTPQTVAAQELRLECMFPADEATEARHLEIMSKAPAA